MDGVFQHDPLYPTECDKNGNINNVVQIGEADESAKKDTELTISNTMNDESAQSKEVNNADDAKADVNSRDVASPNLSDNICDSTLTNQGYWPIEKADIFPDVECNASLNVNCIVQGINQIFNIHSNSKYYIYRRKS